MTLQDFLEVYDDTHLFMLLDKEGKNFLDDETDLFCRNQITEDLLKSTVTGISLSDKQGYDNICIWLNKVK